MRTSTSKYVSLSTCFVVILPLFLVIHETSSSINCQCRINSSAVNTIDVSCKRGPSGPPVCSKAVRGLIPEGYHYLPGLGLYKLHTASKTYEGGQKTCAKEGARLAIPQSDAMAAAMTRLFTRDSGITFAFVGVDDLESTDFYQGSDGQLAPWLNWAKGEPNHAEGKEHCVAMGRDKLMNDFPCDRIFPFFCERKLKTPLPQGYVFVERRGFYKVYRDKKTFHEAEAQCQSDGAHLAVPETLGEAEALIQVTRADWNLGAVWIGISDEDDEGNFLTVHGTPVEDLEFDNWSGGEPNDANGNEDCVAFLPYGFLNDVSCLNKNSFVCEFLL